MLLNVLVVDDDDYTLNRHYNGIMQLANLYNVGVEITKFSCAEGELRQHIKEKNIDFVLLDIEIGKKSGLSVGHLIRKYHPFSFLVFVTKHGQYIERANELHPDAFLTKPYTAHTLEQLFCRVLLMKRGQMSMEESNTEIITLCVDREDIDVRQDQILYIKTLNRRLQVVTTKETYMISARTIKQMLKELPYNFIQAGRDVIINKFEVIHAEKGRLTMSNHDIIDIPLYTYNKTMEKIRSHDVFRERT